MKGDVDTQRSKLAYNQHFAYEEHYFTKIMVTLSFLTSPSENVNNF